MRTLYTVYQYLRDRDLSEQSNTSRLLHESLEPGSGTTGYLLSRLADEFQELMAVLSGEHVHAGRQHDTILEASQVCYWLMLLAVSRGLRFNDMSAPVAMFQGYEDEDLLPTDGSLQECLDLLGAEERIDLMRGFRGAFELVGWACAQVGVSLLAPAEYDLEQMQRKGLVKLYDPFV